MPPADSDATAPPPRRSLLRKYTAAFLAVVGIPLLVYTIVSVWYAAEEHRSTLVEVQRANAETAAFRITQFIKEIEGQLRWGTHLSWSEAGAEQRRIDALRLLRQVPAITDLAMLDGDGRERVFVSRVSINRLDARTDRSRDPAFEGARAGGPYYGPVYFRRDTEPFMTIAVAGTRPEAGVVLAEVNLKYTQDVVSRVRVGREGKAYVVDRRGRLIAHPDASLVLRNTDLSELMRRLDADPQQALHRTAGLLGTPALLTQAPAAPLDWRVVVELPEHEADAPLDRALSRAFWITAASLLVALGFAAASAWRMVRPIRSLTAGAARLGSGQLDHRIAIDTGDEIEQLGRQFNTMAGELERSYATLERKVEERTQQLSEANRAKSRFLAAASHDLRQPLHALNLLVAQLHADAAPAERERVVRRIESAVGSINGLFDGLLDISKLDAGVVNANVAAFPLQQVLDRVESAFVPDAEARGLRLRIRPSAAWVRSDPVLLERILGNLVGNALRYTRAGGVLIGVRRRGDRLRIETWDTGIGIPSDKHQDIFAEFYQVAPGGHLSGGGLGLGLAIVARLCTLLGHDISVTSQPGRGSCFAVTLAQAAPERRPSAAPAPGVQENALAGRRVLVIDNDAGVLESTCGLLESWGCRVIAARSLAEATTRLDGGPPDLMIADVHLDDGADGLDAIAALRARFEHDFPALVITGDVAQATRDRVAAAGLHVLDKPVAPLRLRTLLTRMAQRAAATPTGERSSRAA
jgi:signal transduction histidine kinase/ActR/RegA family two-component response regulator